MLKDYLKKAQREKWAIGQFNFSSLEQLRGILEAARKKKSPVILGTSEGESRFLDFKEIIALVEISKIKYKIPVFLNLDHGRDLNLIRKAIDFGYSAVHFDGSGLPLEENIKRAKKVVEYAHKRGVLVEGELEYIKKKNLTSPEKAEKFLRKTKIDSLAIAIGNVHGIYKKMPKLDFKRLKEIREKAKVFLVLHGGSGVSKPEIREAIRQGIVKININTELRLAWKKALIQALRAKENRPYKILPQVEEAVQRKVEEKINLFSI